MQSLDVFIVDDDTATRRLIVRLLNNAYPNIHKNEMDTGHEAVERIVEARPKLVILDFNLPVTDGLKICGRIRRNPAMEGIKVLFITGEPTDELRDRAAKAGVDDFLPKPFTNAGFMKAVSGLIGPSPTL